MLGLAEKLVNPKYIAAVKFYSQKVSQMLSQRQLYAAMMNQITEIFHPQQQEMPVRENNHLQLQILEEEFQNAFVDQDFRLCLGKIPKIKELAKNLQDKAKFDYYTQLKEPFELAAQQQNDQAGTTPKATNQKAETSISQEKQQKIEQLKKLATDFEGRLEFQQAKAIYQEMMHVASEIKDHLLAAFCDQMIVQIWIWEEEIEKSDFTKLEIPPFRLVNRARFDCLEAISDKGAAIKKMEN